MDPFLLSYINNSGIVFWIELVNDFRDKKNTRCKQET